MNIAVNTRLLLPGKLEGLGRFTYETLKRLTHDHKEHNFIFLFDRPFAQEFVFSDNITPVVVHPQSRHPLLWYLFFDWGVPAALNKHKADLFFSPDGWLSLRTNVKSLPVIHDLNFFHNPDWVDWAPRLYYNYFFPRFVKKAERIATVSEFSKSDIMQRYAIQEQKVDVVFNGASSAFKTRTLDKQLETRNKYCGGHEYFLFVGLVHPRKNLYRVIKAFEQFREQTDNTMRLLVVGATKYMSKDVKDAYESSTYKSDILFSGRVPDSELKHITASAFAQVYVSLFEGFGIPILESMQCEVPVITSNTTSMPEVGGNAVCYVDPYSVQSIAEGMVKLHKDEKFRKDLLTKAKNQLLRFSWEQTAEKTWGSIEKVLCTV